MSAGLNQVTFCEKSRVICAPSNVWSCSRYGSYKMVPMPSNIIILKWKKGCHNINFLFLLPIAICNAYNLGFSTKNVGSYKKKSISWSKVYNTWNVLHGCYFLFLCIKPDNEYSNSFIETTWSVLLAAHQASPLPVVGSHQSTY